MKKDYCLLCQKYVDSIIDDKILKYKDDVIDIEYEGRIAKCPFCGEELFNDEVNKYNQNKIKEKYSIEYEIISKEEIEEIIKKYNIGKRPLSLLLGFGEITITRYLEGYVPTPKNSKILKNILNNPTDYYSLLQSNKNNITEIAYKKSLNAVKTILGINVYDEVLEEVSKYIVNKIETTNMALQKLLYYIQMFCMVFYKKDAFNSKCSAWKYGPAFGSIYYKYKIFDKSIIHDDKPTKDFDEDLRKTVDSVLRSFGCYTGLVLKNFTHKEEPWINAYNTEKKIIEKNKIKEYGEKIIKEYNINNINEINKYSEHMLKELYF